MKRMNRNLCAFIQLTVILWFAVSCCHQEDSFLQSVKISARSISPVDSLDLEQFEIYCPIQLFKNEYGFIINDASPSNRYAALMINPYHSQPKYIRFLPKGRGPGEIVSPSALISKDTLLLVFDYSSQKLLSLDFVESLSNNESVIDTVADYSSVGIYSTPYPVRNGFIAPFFNIDDCWFALFAQDSIQSFVRAPQFEAVKGASPSFRMNYIANSHAVVDQNGERFCCASLQSAALSFSKISNGQIMEQKRYESVPPKLSASGLTLAPDSPRGISALSCDEDRVYVLYSGKPMNTESEEPSWECQHLIVFDWTGTPEKHYILNHPVCSIAVEGEFLYCGTSHPFSRILRYKIEKPF